eukprot:NODE_79_length_23048_cov_0.747614.p14 type:complete len:158 gc:universal NODE_79_length_23048_cov_0.747614:5849-5376(-)
MTALQMDLNSVLLHSIIKMLHRILFKQDMFIYMFKMQYLHILISTLEKPLDVSDGERKSLVQLTDKIGKKIKEHLKKDPKHIIEFYFSKTKNDVYRIRGYTKNGNDFGATPNVRVSEQIELEDSSEEEKHEAGKIFLDFTQQLWHINLESPSLCIEE